MGGEGGAGPATFAEPAPLLPLTPLASLSQERVDSRPGTGGGRCSAGLVGGPRAQLVSRPPQWRRLPPLSGAPSRLPVPAAPAAAQAPPRADSEPSRYPPAPPRGPRLSWQQAATAAAAAASSRT
ncbi:unnamed protein product [Rangifer tarandus platyrhynchus]|uniref:Uncharacterized protein n=1 Tax=Rangifer tarandus platyrhynchus TaxID=3082113 RepID=A0ABN8ZY11_RANTA|nr:unnamed protein product [Rangifer tarandus platyrhynchus]